MAQKRRSKKASTKKASSKKGFRGYSEQQTSMVLPELPIEVFIPEDQYIDYADAWAIIHSEDEFIISFLQLQWPIAVTQRQLEAVEAAETVCISRIALSHRRMPVFIQSVISNWKQFLAEQQAKETIANAEGEGATAKETE